MIPLLHPDFVELGSSGRVYTEDMMIQRMLQQTPGVVRIKSFDVKEITPEVALVTSRLWVPKPGDTHVLRLGAPRTRLAARVPPGHPSP